MTASTQIRPMPGIGESPHRLVLFKHRVVSHQELQKTLGTTFDELYTRIGMSGVAPAGPPFVIYLDDSDYGVRWSIDVCAPVSAPISAAPAFEYREMPVERIVSVIHVGPYDGLAKVYAEIDQYMKDNDLTVAGPPREFYLSEPDVAPEKIQTLVEWPIA